MVHVENSPDIYVILKENWLWNSKTGSSHGSHYSYDTHIPLIFSKNGIEGYKIDDPISSVDVSPSIARYLGAKYPKDIDGSALKLKFYNN